MGIIRHLFSLRLGSRAQTGFFSPKNLPTLPLSSSEDLLAVHVYVCAARDLPHARLGEARASLLRLYWLLGTYDQQWHF